MTTLFGHDVRSELLLLYIFEFLVCFALVYPVVAFADVWVGGPVNGAATVTALILALLSGAASGASGLYRPAAWGRTRQLVLGTIVASVLLLPAVVLLLILLAPPGASYPTWRGLTDTASAAAAAMMLTRLGFIAVQRTGWLTRRIALVGHTSVEQVDFPVRGVMGSSFEIALFLSPDGELQPAQLRRHRIWGVAAASGAALPDAVHVQCARTRVRALAGPGFLESHLGRVNTAILPDDWLHRSRAMRQGRLGALVVRCLDLVFASGLLLFTLPVLALTALAIKCDSPGPVFYHQQRVGLGGRTFRLVKFRSMTVDAERGGVAVWAARADARVTRVGRIIRLLRIDEIPQVLNVIRGDMAFIGPRPERPSIVQMLAAEIPHYEDRACVKPGITGWAQVNFPYGASVEDARMKLAYDLYYVKRRSLFLDLLILVATVRVVLFQEGSR